MLACFVRNVLAPAEAQSCLSWLSTDGARSPRLAHIEVKQTSSVLEIDATQVTLQAFTEILGS